MTTTMHSFMREWENKARRRELEYEEGVKQGRGFTMEPSFLNGFSELPRINARPVTTESTRVRRDGTGVPCAMCQRLCRRGTVGAFCSATCRDSATQLAALQKAEDREHAQAGQRRNARPGILDFQPEQPTTPYRPAKRVQIVDTAVNADGTMARRPVTSQRAAGTTGIALGGGASPRARATLVASEDDNDMVHAAKNPEPPSSPRADSAASKRSSSKPSRQSSRGSRHSAMNGGGSPAAGSSSRQSARSQASAAASLRRSAAANSVARSARSGRSQRSERSGAGSSPAAAAARSSRGSHGTASSMGSHASSEGSRSQQAWLSRSLVGREYGYRKNQSKLNQVLSYADETQFFTEAQRSYAHHDEEKRPESQSRYTVNKDSFRRADGFTAYTEAWMRSKDLMQKAIRAEAQRGY